MTQATPNYGLFYGPYAGGVGPLCLYQILSGQLYSFKSYKGIPKFRNWVTWPSPRPLRGRFIIRTQGVSVLYDCTKCEADSSIRSNVIRGSQSFKIGSRVPGHVQLGVILWSVRRRGASSMSVPNLNRISLFLQMLLEGPIIRKLGHVTRPTPT